VAAALTAFSYQLSAVSQKPHRRGSARLPAKIAEIAIGTAPRPSFSQTIPTWLLQFVSYDLEKASSEKSVGHRYAPMAAGSSAHAAREPIRDSAALTLCCSQPVAFRTCLLLSGKR